MQPDTGRRSHQQLVQIGETEFFVELSRAGGPETASAERAMSFDGVRETIEAVAGQLGQTWAAVKPSEASVEFALSVKAKAGKLTGLIVEAASDASFKVTLTWKGSDGPTARG